jgi:signal peptidase II
MKQFFRLCVYVVGASLIIGVDRITKIWALTLSGEQYINEYLSFDLVYNRGISWGLFNSSHAMPFYVVTGAIILLMSILGFHALSRLHAGKSIWGEVLVLAGGSSNIYDRFVYHGVIDFIQVSFHDFHWPVFNVADVAIVIGVSFMFYHAFKEL